MMCVKRLALFVAFVACVALPLAVLAVCGNAGAEDQTDCSHACGFGCGYNDVAYD